MVKSQILQTCLQTLFMLPPRERLKSYLPPLNSAPDVQVTARSRAALPSLGAGSWVLGWFAKPLPRVRARRAWERTLARDGFHPGCAAALP